MKALAPTPERFRHGNVGRFPVIADTYGAIGRPWHCRSLLDNLLAKNQISNAEFTAGMQFHEIARLAAADPLKAADILREPPQGIQQRDHGSERARRQRGLALDALGGLDSPMGSLAWDVLGCDDSLGAWSLRQRWTGRSRQPHTAKGVLLATLSMLALHFGLTTAKHAR